MISSDFRAEARRKLAGKWGKAVCIVLAFFAFTFVIGFIESFFPDSMESIVNIIDIIINVPLTFGLVFAFFKLFNDEEVKAFDFVTLGFSNFKKSWGVAFQIFLKMILPEIAVIISYVVFMFGCASKGVAVLSDASMGASAFSTFMLIIGSILLVVSVVWAVTKSYYYQLAYLVAVENEDMTSADAVEESERLMTGKRSALFWLQLSFIGWAILCVVTLGIGYLWLTPYVQFAIIAFYKYATGKAETIEIDNANDGKLEN